MRTAKKLLAMFFVASTMVFASCEKDDDKDGSKSLIGTTWEAQQRDWYEGDDGQQLWYTETYILSFTSESICTLRYVYQDDGAEPDDEESMRLTYTFDGNDGSMSDDDETLTFSVVGDRLMLNIEHAYSLVFTRR